ncbi:arginine-ornithine antiporter [Liquorilactobacillus satsumensis]|uniref:arginine-ornithine antiporter n=1 Tax=Liquorilactobacillus satsumensis TaxID=259059 RepID=UPI0021C2E78A|nr:arginine-ornithine antiporter [Liquorilactobacillus satsumensis]MCP9313276.1 arginine-ornithine antiporter [Liquorilactobacillus satsumensis]MCP9360474.1 arginine-ornithine antiporter [Liquorilactobacillus satsumensis]
MKEKSAGIGKGELVALIVSSSIGAGIFGINSDLASASAPGPALLAWLLVGIGILALVLSLNNLAKKRPELDAGIFSYAEASFGKLGGFISGWGYWLSAWLGNIAFATMLMSSIGTFIPTFKGGQNIPSIIGAAVFVWLLTMLVNNGIESASLLNMIVTFCKLVPLFVFIVICIVSFKAGVFTSDFWGNVTNNVLHERKTLNTFSQVKGCVMVMMWVFVGIEGASILANRAKNRSDAQTATVLGLIALLIIYVFASILPYGVMTQEQLAQSSQPAMAEVLRHIVGTWGATLISIGLIISILGAWLSWTMLPAETTILMAKHGTLPRLWGKLNVKKAPTASLVITGIMQSLFLLTFLVTDYAYNFAYTLCTAAILICYLLVGIYQMEYSYQNREWGEFLIGVIAATFQLLAMVLAGWQQVLVVVILYIPGFYFYWAAAKERDRQVTNMEKIVMTVISLLGILAIYLLITGKISL